MCIGAFPVTKTETAHPGSPAKALSHDSATVWITLADRRCTTAILSRVSPPRYRKPSLQVINRFGQVTDTTRFRPSTHHGSSVTYYALAESVWNADEKRRGAHVMHSFGRADQLDRAELERLVRSINRVLDDGDDDAGSCRSGRQPRCHGWNNVLEQVF